MTRKQRRAAFIAAGLGILGIAVALVLFAMRDNIVFFYSPTDVMEKSIKPGERVRLRFINSSAMTCWPVSKPMPKWSITTAAWLDECLGRKS